MNRGPDIYTYSLIVYTATFHFSIDVLQNLQFLSCQKEVIVACTLGVLPARVFTAAPGDAVLIFN